MEPVPEPEHVWSRLVSAREAYRAAVPPEYDEVLLEVAQRAEDAGSIGKADIGALVVWKRLPANTRWVSELMSVPEADVRAVTARAVAAVRDVSLVRGEAAQQGREVLWELPGFRHGAALASAVLTAAAPQRMAVYDRRARQGLEWLGYSLGGPRGRYGRYMDLLGDLLDRSGPGTEGWTARDVDTALYWLGGQG
ncbi:hypothetical protein ABZW18_25110 [Streptomyces sp. NPDC004647]|uniref:hypothetical protein n=1 Tax=Streptomyces sp. NPDC004647 TaxID=3154671 RepID=UPI0033AF6B63